MMSMKQPNAPVPPGADVLKEPTAGLPEAVEIQGVRLHLSHPHAAVSQWIGQREILKQLLACWLGVDDRDLPLTPRLVGTPGIGKTTLGMAGAQTRKQDLFIYQCTADTRPEDLLVTPVLAESGKIAYHASALVTAMITGGIVILDEGNRMNEKSWASLAPLLDHRRYIESVVAGITVQAHRDFRCAVTMNQDDSTYEIPDYILSRLQPTLKLGFPNKHDEKAILKYHLPFAEDQLLELTVEFLQQAHALKLDFSPRDGVNLLRYAIKRMASDPDPPLTPLPPQPHGPRPRPPHQPRPGLERIPHPVPRRRRRRPRHLRQAQETIP